MRCEFVLLVLTQADGSEQPQTVLWGEAGGEQRLQDVVREGKSNDRLISGVDHQHSNPQPQKSVEDKQTRLLLYFPNKKSTHQMLIQQDFND